MRAGEQLYLHGCWQCCSTASHMLINEMTMAALQELCVNAQCPLDSTLGTTLPATGGNDT